MTQVKIMPGTDCGGRHDHVTVVAQIRAKVKKVKRTGRLERTETS